MSGQILFLDPIGGLAGDMICAALLDLGGDLEALRRGLGALGIDGYEISLSRVTRGVFDAAHFHVRPLASAKAPAPADRGHGHSHDHGHGHSHQHDHDPDEELWPGQPDRRWRTIRALIRAASLPERVRTRSLAIFELLARAEARVHGMDLEEVAFHEVGAVDSIVDIVGCCLLLEQLDVTRLVVGPIPLSHGRARTAHGLIPLPAPATAELLRGWPIEPGLPGIEQVTPTGAAIVAALAQPGPLPPMILGGTGFGAGTRDTPARPNVVRAILGEGRPAPPEALEVDVIAAQVDDMPGEWLPPLIEQLLEAGALDVTATPNLMKKGRPGLRIEVLSPPLLRERLEDLLLRHSSTFGLRHHRATRRVLDRRHELVQTPYGPVRVKIGLLAGEEVQAAPEHEDVLAAARAHGQSVARVHASAVAAWMSTSKAREGA